MKTNVYLRIVKSIVFRASQESALKFMVKNFPYNVKTMEDAKEIRMSVLAQEYVHLDTLNVQIILVSEGLISFLNALN